MFSESLVESTPLLRSRNRWPAFLSIALQLFIAALLIAVPILHPERISTGPMRLATLAPPPLRTTPPPPPPQPVRTIATANASAPAATSAATLAAHAFTALLHAAGPPVDTPVIAIGLGTGPTVPGLPASLNPGSPSIVVTPSKPAGRLNISSGVTAGLLIDPIRPVYPAIARVTHTEGTVVVQAIISRSGKIESAHVISGPEMLQRSALDAVRSARYHPYLLNNQPTEVETTISIVFHIGGGT